MRYKTISIKVKTKLRGEVQIEEGEPDKSINQLAEEGWILEHSEPILYGGSTVSILFVFSKED